jgi:hypothetical protein
LLGASRAGAENQGQRKRLGEDVSGRVHASEQTPWR